MSLMSQFKPDDFFQQLRDGFQEASRKVSDFVEGVMQPGDSETVSADTYYTASHYVVEVELPGVSKERVGLQITDGVMTVKGSRPEAEGLTAWDKRERSRGAFIRSFTLPSDADAEQVKARYESGLLIVRFPRILEAGPGITDVPLES